MKKLLVILIVLLGFFCNVVAQEIKRPESYN